MTKNFGGVTSVGTNATIFVMISVHSAVVTRILRNSEMSECILPALDGQQCYL